MSNISRGKIRLVIFLSFLLLSCFSLNARQVNAQNYVWGDPPADAKPIVIDVTSPISNQIYHLTNITVAFTVSLPTKGTIVYTLYDVSFKATWMAEKVIVFNQSGFFDHIEYDKAFSDVPEGNQTIQIVAHGCGSYADTPEETPEGTEYFFFTSSSCTVNFTVTASPKISVMSPLNDSIYSSVVPLNFTLDKEVSWLGYSIDGENNMAINGNTTIANLPNGLHNLTVYARDAYGNVGSQTASFTVEKPKTGFFSSTNTAVAAAVITAAVCLTVGLLLCRRHRKAC